MFTLQTLWEKSAYRKYGWTQLLWPFSLLFKCLARANRYLYATGIKPVYRSHLPIVVVGNITVGGTGKSPVVSFIVKKCLEEGLKPAIISRGYKGHATQFPLLVNELASAELVGDEPMMLYHQTRVPVVIDPIRSRAVQFLESTTDCNIIISDDGLQHYALARDYEICVIDASRRFGNESVLPAGPLREAKSRLREVQLCLINGEYFDVGASIPTCSFALMPLDFVNVATGEVLALDEWAMASFTAVCGIGNPRRFFHTLSLLRPAASINTQSFPDHHAFKASDFDEATSCFVMTEKDAMKCLQFNDERLWYLRVSVKLDTKDEALLMNGLRKVLL